MKKNIIVLAVIAIVACTQKKEQPPVQPTVHTDTIQNFENYTHLHPKFSIVNDFMQLNDLSTLPAGRGNIDSTIFYIVTKDSLKSKNNVQLESHKKYVDVQVVMTGTEQYGWKPVDACSQISVPYDAEKDIMFYADTPDKWLTNNPDQFIIFFPQDAHAPMVGEGAIHKVVIKIPVE